MKFKATEHPISWFRDRSRDGTLEIRPPYQRKPVWTVKQKSFLIESILEDLPIPEIFIHVTTTARGDTKYAIVDGQQRVRTVLQFIGAEPAPTDPQFEDFSLDALDASSPWKDSAFDDLDETEKVHFWEYMLGVRYLTATDDKSVRDVFRRLNKYLMQLKGQELRNALYSGPFVNLTLTKANDEFWASARIVTPASIRRSGDVEFVSELFIGLMYGPQGGSIKVIDDYYAAFEEYEDEVPGQRDAERLFDHTLQTTRRLLPDSDLVATRWHNKADFYSLFLTLGHLLRDKRLRDIKGAKDSLLQFAEKVNAAINQGAKAATGAARYARAIEKGSNDKKRRSVRHEVLLKVLGPHFEER
jgi:hypothetical protein